MREFFNSSTYNPIEFTLSVHFQVHEVDDFVNQLKKQKELQIAFAKFCRYLYVLEFSKQTQIDCFTSEKKKICFYKNQIKSFEI